MMNPQTKSWFLRQCFQGSSHTNSKPTKICAMTTTSMLFAKFFFSLSLSSSWHWAGSKSAGGICVHTNNQPHALLNFLPIWQRTNSARKLAVIVLLLNMNDLQKNGQNKTYRQTNIQADRQAVALCGKGKKKEKEIAKNKFQGDLLFVPDSISTEQNAIAGLFSMYSYSNLTCESLLSRSKCQCWCTFWKANTYRAYVPSRIYAYTRTRYERTYVHAYA